jgi:hypothetical protein
MGLMEGTDCFASTHCALLDDATSECYNPELLQKSDHAT